MEMPWPPSPEGTWAEANSSPRMRAFRMSGSPPCPPYSAGMVARSVAMPDQELLPLSYGFGAHPLPARRLVAVFGDEIADFLPEFFVLWAVGQVHRLPSLG